MSSPNQMYVITNLQPPVAGDPVDTLSFPEGAILTVTTSKPLQTEDITFELRDSQNNLIEVDQVDPEFNPQSEVMQIRIQRQGDPLKGTIGTVRIEWDDAGNEHHTEAPQRVHFT